MKKSAMPQEIRMNMRGKSKIVANGIFASNPVFRLVLGMCPTLAISTSAFNGLGMGVAATVVLVCSNALVSLLRRVIPDKVRIPAYVLIIATFVTLVEMLLRKFVPALYDALGIYLPLIVVNCIILARAEAFASTNKVGDSVLDGLGMGLGFTLALLLLGVIREFLGSGTFFVGSFGDAEFGVTPGDMPDYAMSVFVMPAGGFLTLGLVMAAINAISDRFGQGGKEARGGARRGGRPHRRSGARARGKGARRGCSHSPRARGKGTRRGCSYSRRECGGERCFGGKDG